MGKHSKTQSLRIWNRRWSDGAVGVEALLAEVPKECREHLSY